jgi:hypothetical protein
LADKNAIYTNGKRRTNKPTIGIAGIGGIGSFDDEYFRNIIYARMMVRVRGEGG